MTTFMIRYKTKKCFDLQLCKKSYANGSRDLVNISCKHIGNVYLSRKSKHPLLLTLDPMDSFLINCYHGNAKKHKIHLTL